MKRLRILPKRLHYPGLTPLVRIGSRIASIVISSRQHGELQLHAFMFFTADHRANSYVFLPVRWEPSSRTPACRV